MKKRAMHRRNDRLKALVLVALCLIAAGLACGRERAAPTPLIIVATPTPGGAEPTPIVVVATPTPGGEGQPTVPAPPTSTPIPGGCTNGMQFLADVTVPDSTVFSPNEPFVKTWRVGNTGSCDWVGYHIVFDHGEPMGTMDQLIPDTPAGQEVEISVEMTSPGGAGNYTGVWQVRSPDGANLGDLTCVIVVKVVEEEVTPTTETPPTGVEVNFRADDDSLSAGECTTLRWDVEGAQEVYYQGEGVTGHGEQQECPTQTTIYTLHIVLPDGSATDHHVTVNVLGEAEETEPPELTLQHSPASPTTNDQITFTASASDPSGLDRIEILVEYVLAQTCPDSPCVYQGGPYPAGPVHYGANAYDTHGNRAWTGYRTLNVE